jgi:hypothetical protein
MILGSKKTFQEQGVRMKFAIVKLWLLLIISALAGCVAPPLSLPSKSIVELKRLDAVMLIPQSNLNIDVQAGNAGNTGILGAIIVYAIDDARRAKASQAQASLTNMVKDFDFRSKMMVQQTAEFNRIKTNSLIAPIQFSEVDSDSQRKILYDSSKASAILFSSVIYKWIDGSLVATSDNIIYPKTAALNSLRDKPNNASILDIGNAIYRKKFNFKKESITTQNITAALNEAVTNLAWQLASDLNHELGASNRLTSALPLAGSVQIAVNSNSATSIGSPANIRLEDVDAVPYLSDRGREIYRAYLTKATPKAFAIAETGRLHSSWGARPANPSDPIDVSERALSICAKANNAPCKLYAVGNVVVWQVPAVAAALSNSSLGTPQLIGSQPGAATSTARVQHKPSNPVRITPDLVQNKTWIYPHPRDVARFGNVELSFSNNSVAAKNNQSTTQGTYQIQEDMLCLSLKSWGDSCYFVLEDADGKFLVSTSDGTKSKVTIR